MGRVAFVFSGQGAQYPGMGRELYEGAPAARQIFEKLEAIRPGTMEQCFHGEGELNLTGNTQPCMFAVELAAAAALGEKGIKADMTAGFSLGELAALTFAGALSLEDGFRLVTRRGELMQRAAEENESGMAAVLKLSAPEVESLCEKFQHIWPVNYNCPGQISVAGAKSELTAFAQEVKAAGGRAIVLRVQGAFHSPYMASAGAAFKAVLDGFSMLKTELPVYSDYTGLPYEGDYAGLLVNQMTSPVRWQSIVENMTAAGADTFIELGPGTTLCGLIKKTDPSVRVYHVENIESLNETLSEVKKC